MAHPGLTELHLVDSMHERKALMASRSDAFIALPGGFGTFDELFEIITWGQLGLHRKPMGMLDVGGYFGRLPRAGAPRAWTRASFPPRTAALAMSALAGGAAGRAGEAGAGAAAHKWLDPRKT